MRKTLCMLLTALLICTCTCAFAHAEGEWTCESCRHTNAGNFCANCGAKKPEMQAAPNCPNCTFALAPNQDAKFCPNCGYALGAAQTTGIKYTITGTAEAQGKKLDFLEAACLLPDSGEGILMTVDALTDGDHLARQGGLYLTAKEILLGNASEWVRLVDLSGSPISVVSILDALDSAQKASEAATMRVQKAWAVFLKLAVSKAVELNLQDALSYNPTDDTFVFTLDSKQVKAYLDALIDGVTQDVRIAALLEDTELLSALGISSLAGWQNALTAFKPEYAFIAEDPIRLTVSGSESALRVKLEQLSSGNAYHADAFFYSAWRGHGYQGTLNVYEVVDGVTKTLLGGNFTLTNEYSDLRTFRRDTYRLSLSLAADDSILAGNFLLVHTPEKATLSVYLTDSIRPIFDGELTLTGDADSATATLRLSEATQALHRWNETYTLTCGEDDMGRIFLGFQTGKPAQELRVNAILEEIPNESCSQFTVSWSDAASPSNDGSVTFRGVEAAMESGDWQVPQAASDQMVNISLQPMRAE